MHTIKTLTQQKTDKKKIVALALYDASFAAIAAHVGIEMIIVGDSLGMVVQGYRDTIKVRLRDMVYHTSCVSRASGKSFIVADMPFASYSNVSKASESAAHLMRAGANMVKIEGGIWLKPVIEHLCNNGMPVCGHLGLTPQSIHILGGFKLQGKTAEEADTLIQASVELERAGASMLVLECVPSKLAKTVSNELSIPIIGIGAGVDTDGQVLVVYDLIGISQSNRPRFVKNFMDTAGSVEQAITDYAHQVRTLNFPTNEHSYLI